MPYNRKAYIHELKGKVFTSVKEIDDELYFCMEEGHYRMYHSPQCCEIVLLEDVCGDLSDLVGTPILLAEEVYGDWGPLAKNAESYTWVFYKLSTIKGDVTLRWYGESNGNYSEEAYLTWIQYKEK